MRLYVPATLDELDAPTLAADGVRWDVAPRRAHALTPALVRALADEDDEGREYSAFLAAADDSLALIAGLPGAAPLRVVLTVEVPEAVVRLPVGSDGDGAHGIGLGGDGTVGADGIELGADEPVSAVVIAASARARVVCAHVDEPEAAADVAAAVAALEADATEADHDEAGTAQPDNTEPDNTEPDNAEPGAAAAGPAAPGGAALAALAAALDRVAERDLLWYDASELAAVPRADA